MQVGRRGRRRSTVIMADEALLMQTLFKEEEARQQHRRDVVHNTVALDLAARSNGSSSYASGASSGSGASSDSSHDSGSESPQSPRRSPSSAAGADRSSGAGSLLSGRNADTAAGHGSSCEPGASWSSAADPNPRQRRSSLQSRRGSVQSRRASVQSRRGSMRSRRGSVSSLSSAVSGPRAKRLLQKRVKRLNRSLGELRASWAHEVEVVFELIARPRVGVGPDELAQVVPACPPRVRRQLDQLVQKWRHEVSIGTKAANMDLKAFTRLIVSTFYEPVMARAVDKRLDIAAVRIPFSLAIMAMRRQLWVLCPPPPRTHTSTHPHTCVHPLPCSLRGTHTSCGGIVLQQTGSVLRHVYWRAQASEL